jgi:predicted nucleic acid-binding protein
MSLFEEAMSLAVQLPQAERERLAQALGVLRAAPKSSAPKSSAPKSSASKSSGPSLPMASLAARPDPVAWRKAETGHAVLDTGDTFDTGDAPDEGANGAAALHGLWSARRDEFCGESTPAGMEALLLASQLPRGTPVVLHTDVCLALACGEERAATFFEAAAVEVRLATATYLALLDMAQNAAQQARVARFVQPFAVLSLGPMASSRAVELMREYSVADGLAPLDALIAATALAHEIPLVARAPRRFIRIEGLTVASVG